MLPKKVFLAGYHNRHTDDQFKTFEFEEDAKRQCREWIGKTGYDGIVENSQYGDWCCYVSDDYYAFIQLVTLE